VVVGAQARRLQEDAGLREALGEGARAHARETFSTEREVDALLEAYRAAQAS
jgi:glycosyltransferase involved in cell wall biosynthesis